MNAYFVSGLWHPAFAAGGAQLMASEMNRAAREAGHETRLIVALEESDSARVFSSEGALAVRRGDPALSIFGRRSFDDEMLSAGNSSAYAELRTFIERFRPDVAHFHHYLRLGVEAIVAARLAAPKARISLTLHEMLAICPANGRMVKPRTREICTAASPPNAPSASLRAQPSSSPGANRASKRRSDFATHSCSPR